MTLVADQTTGTVRLQFRLKDNATTEGGTSYGDVTVRDESTYSSLLSAPEEIKRLAASWLDNRKECNEIVQ